MLRKMHTETKRELFQSSDSLQMEELLYFEKLQIGKENSPDQNSFFSMILTLIRYETKEIASQRTERSIKRRTGWIAFSAESSFDTSMLDALISLVTRNAIRAIPP